MNIAALKNNKETSPVLIIDKLGIIGEALAREFSKDNLVVLLSESLFSKVNSNILHIPFKKKIPEVPDNDYLKIFIIDDGTSVTRESAFSFINKALENNAPLYFIGSIRNIDVEHSDDIVKSYNNSKVLLFGDLFDNNIVFDKDSAVNKFIASIRSDQKIEVGGNGLSLSFPITFSDTIKLIIKATQLNLVQKVILLFSGVPITDIALAKAFKEVKPVIRIESVKAQRNKKIYIPKGAMHALEKYDLQSRIKALDLGKPVSRPQIKQKPVKQIKNKIFYLFLILLFTLFIPFISTYLLIFGGNLLLNESFKAVNNNEVNNAIKFSRYSSYAFNLSEKTAKILSVELWALRLSSLENHTLNQVVAGRYLSDAGNEISNAFLGFDDVYRGKTNFPRDSFNSSANLYKSGIANIEKAQALEIVPKDVYEFFNNLGFASDVLSNSPEGVLNFFGFNSEKKYLVLVIDNKYSKPIGGLISDLKVIKVKDGKIISSADIDPNELKGYAGKPLEVPFFAKRYGEVKNPTLQNSIFKINFLSNAADINTFYQFSNSDLLDGVISIDKKTLESMSGKSLIEAIKTLGNSIKHKDVIFSSFDDSLENIINSADWGGGIYDSRIDSKSVVSDFFGIVETNLDNKVSNDLISKTVSKKITLSSGGDLSSTLTIAIKNSDSKNYKSYLQLLLPQSLITEIKINGVKQKTIPAVTNEKIYDSKYPQPSKGLEVNDEIQNNKKVEGFLIEVPAGGIETISVTYQISKVTQDSFSYSLNVYKQPGISDYQVNLSFDKPSNYQIIDYPKNLDLTVDEDKNFSVLFSQK